MSVFGLLVLCELSVFSFYIKIKIGVKSDALFYAILVLEKRQHIALLANDLARVDISFIPVRTFSKHRNRRVNSLVSITHHVGNP